MNKKVDLSQSKNILTDIKDFLLGEDEDNYVTFQTTEILQKEFLNQVTYKDVPFFSLNGYKTWAKCVKLYDGDTGTFAFFLNGRPFKFRVRLAEIDTAELKSKDRMEVVMAQKAKNVLQELIGDGLVYLECLKFDKYGRVLGKLYRDEKKDLCFSDVLVSRGFAYPYKGGKRENFAKWYKGDCTNEQNRVDDNIHDSEVLSRSVAQDDKFMAEETGFKAKWKKFRRMFHKN